MSIDSQKALLRPCPICLHGTGSVLHHQAFILTEGHPLGDGYDVVVCAKCGFGFADVGASQEAYDEFYEKHSKYESAEWSTSAGVTPTDKARLQAMALQLREAWPRTDLHILDLGCGSGGLLRELRDMGYRNITGLDPSAGCVRYLRENLGIEAVQGHVGSLAQIPNLERVVLSHVLEHVRDVKGSMSSLANALPIGGQIYLEVPDAERYPEFYQSPFHFFDTEHINHFGRISLRNCAEQSGFKVLAQGGKSIPISEGVDYPAIWLIAEKPTSTQIPEIKYDDALLPALVTYIQQSSVGYPAVLAELAARQEPLVVWGVGCSTLRLLAETPLGNANIVAFTDNNKLHHGGTLMNLPIVAPEELEKLGDVSILVTSKLYGAHIQAQIRESLHLENEIMMCYEP